MPPGSSWGGGVPHQIVLPVFGAQHGGHLLQVGGVAALLGAGGEAHGDDPLRDVDQVHLIALLHGLYRSLCPGGRGGDGTNVQPCYRCCENISLRFLSRTNDRFKAISRSSLLCFLERKIYTVPHWLLTRPLLIKCNLFHRPNRDGD